MTFTKKAFNKYSKGQKLTKLDSYGAKQGEYWIEGVDGDTFTLKQRGAKTRIKHKKSTIRSEFNVGWSDA